MSVRDVLHFFGFARRVTATKSFTATKMPTGVQRLPLSPDVRWAAHFQMEPADDWYRVVFTEHDSLDLGFYVQIADLRVIGSDVESCATEYLKSIGIRKVVAA